MKAYLFGFVALNVVLALVSRNALFLLMATSAWFAALGYTIHTAKEQR